MKWCMLLGAKLLACQFAIMSLLIKKRKKQQCLSLKEIRQAHAEKYLTSALGGPNILITCHHQAKNVYFTKTEAFFTSLIAFFTSLMEKSFTLFILMWQVDMCNSCAPFFLWVYNFEMSILNSYAVKYFKFCLKWTFWDGLEDILVQIWLQKASEKKPNILTMFTDRHRGEICANFDKCRLWRDVAKQMFLRFLKMFCCVI